MWAFAFLEAFRPVPGVGGHFGFRLQGSTGLHPFWVGGVFPVIVA